MKKTTASQKQDAATLDRFKVLGIAIAIVGLPIWIAANSGGQNKSQAVKELEYKQCMEHSIDGGSSLEMAHKNCQ